MMILIINMLLKNLIKNLPEKKINIRGLEVNSKKIRKILSILP